MRFLATILVAAVAATADTIKITAQTSLKFSPDSVEAKAGDILEFHFQPQNHSVAMGEFNSINGPCVPAPVGSGFFSGYMPTSADESDKVFRVTINNTDPIVFYCTQGQHCAKGMVGVVNPSGDKTLAGYVAKAGSVSKAVAPPAIEGGVIADAGSSAGGASSTTSAGSGQATTTGTGSQKTGGAAPVRAYDAAVLGAVGLAVMMI